MSTEETALASLAEVITEAQRLVDVGNEPYNQALVDLTMARLRSDVEFLILGDPAPAMPTSQASASKWWIVDHPGAGAVVHANKGCYFLSRATGYHLANAADIRIRPQCLRCSP